MTLRRSIFACVTGSYVVFAIQVAASVILARLLTPAQMGVWSVAQGAIFLSSTLRDFGAGDYLVRSGEIDARAIGRVMGLMLCISLCCAAILWFGRPAIAAYFREPRLVGLIGICTITYLLMPFGLGALVILEREYAFATLQIMQITATLASSAVAILLAARGWGFYSLAYGQLVQAGVLLGLRAWLRPAAVFCPPIFRGWGRILHFGSFTTLAAAVGQVSAQSVTAIVGRMAGLTALGFLDRAQGMSNYVSMGLTFPVMQVVYVGLAKVKDKPRELGSLFLLSLENLSAILLPGYAVMAILAHPLIQVIYGPRWLPAAPLFSVICIGGMLISSYSVHVRTLTALGLVQIIFTIEAAMLVLRIGAVLYLMQFGLLPAAIGVVLPSAPTLVLYWLAVRSHIQLGRDNVLRAFVRTAVIVLATVAMPVLLKTQAAGLPAASQLAICLAGAAAGWFSAVILTGHPLKQEFRRLTSAWRRQRPEAESQILPV